MAEINKPDLTNNWGSLGGILEPDSTKIGLGWQEGESPLCEWQNWWQNRADASLSYLYQKGVPEWDTVTEYIANKSMVNYQGNLYLCTTNNTNKLPTDASFWKRTGLALSDIPSASTGVKGIVQLNDTLSSTSTSLALTAKQGKALNDNKVSTTTTVNGKALSGNISLTKTDVGLGNVDDVKQLPNSYLDTSGTLAGNSDTKVPSQKAVKTYADTKLSKASNLSDVANTATARTNLGLTSAATTAVTANNLDTTSGRLLRVGDFGIGNQINIPDAADLNDYKTPGNYAQPLSTQAVSGTNYPIPHAGVLIVEKSGTTTTGVIQKYTKYNSSESYTRSFHVGTWTAWDRTVTASMTGTAYTRNYTTSTTLAANSDSNVPTEKATKTYVDNAIQTNVKDYGLGVIAKAWTDITNSPNGFYYDSTSSHGGQFVIKYGYNLETNTSGFTVAHAYNTNNFFISSISTAGVETINTLLHTGNTTGIVNKAVTTSTTLAGNSDSNVPTEKAVRTYVDTKVGETPFRNRIINGDFLINQRHGTDAVTLVAPGQYNADRWVNDAAQSGKTSSQTIRGDSTGGSSSYLRMKTVSAVTLGSTDIFTIRQNIEGNNIQDFEFGTAAATQITISFWVRASQTGTYNVSFRNNGDNRSYVTTYTINTVDVWEYKTITINGDTSGTWKTDESTGLIICFDFGSGSTFITGTTNTWLAGHFVKSTGTKSLITTLNATLDITLVQLEKGGVATPFEYIPITDSLARCERYYQKCYANTRGYASGSMAIIESPIQFRATMRADPLGSIIAGVRSNTYSVSLGVTPGSYTIGARHSVICAVAGDAYALGEVALFDAEL